MWLIIDQARPHYIKALSGLEHTYSKFINSKTMAFSLLWKNWFLWRYQGARREAVLMWLSQWTSALVLSITWGKTVMQQIHLQSNHGGGFFPILATIQIIL